MCRYAQTQYAQTTSWYLASGCWAGISPPARSLAPAALSISSSLGTVSTLQLYYSPHGVVKYCPQSSYRGYFWGYVKKSNYLNLI